eukprot:GHVH01016352.1.p1 GENE.GHVH01016352.1~~GHVH01016352.1.p1  ORF type:complete len:212 (+),score=21.28 GHVH01016352.1:167-802(+)
MQRKRSSGPTRFNGVGDSSPKVRGLPAAQIVTFGIVNPVGSSVYSHQVSPSSSSRSSGFASPIIEINSFISAASSLFTISNLSSSLSPTSKDFTNLCGSEYTVALANNMDSLLRIRSIQVVHFESFNIHFMVTPTGYLYWSVVAVKNDDRVESRAHLTPIVETFMGTVWSFYADLARKNPFMRNESTLRNAAFDKLVSEAISTVFQDQHLR